MCIRDSGNSYCIVTVGTIIWINKLLAYIHSVITGTQCHYTFMLHSVSTGTVNNFIGYDNILNMLINSSVCVVCVHAHVWMR